MQGPDFANNLVGVLLRFRRGKFAFSADIKSMFYQIKVPVKDADFMRFLWYPGGDLSKAPTQHRILVHVFGAKSSPSCANFTLKHVAESSGPEVSDETKNAIQKSFYVDDILDAMDDEEKLTLVAEEVRKVLKRNGLELVGFVSNSRFLLNSMPSEILSKDIKSLNLSLDQLPLERALGVKWNTENDHLSYHINIRNQPCTKRGILSTLFSIYDPLFLCSPAILTGKRIFQEACSLNIDWDKQIPLDLSERWQKWVSELPLLKNYEVPRWIGSAIGENSSVEIHTFCDGSQTGYGAVSYLRVENPPEEAKISIIMARSRLTPLNKASLKTIPRIELNAAKTAVQLHHKIVSELDMKIDRSLFWSDSQAVLNYIRSEKGRFQTFVSNRVSLIRSLSKVDDWRFVPTQLNPADILSRGSKTIKSFIKFDEWKFGPQFLTASEEHWPTQPNQLKNREDDVEVVSVSAHAVKLEENPALKLLDSTSDWNKLVLRVATYHRLGKILLKRSKSVEISIADMKKADVAIWRFVQKNELREVYQTLQNNETLPKRHPLTKFTPFVDSNGLIRVGGRIDRANSVAYERRHPCILPKNNPYVKMYSRELHRINGHLGREKLLADLKSRFYIIGANNLAKEVTRRCLICRKVQGRPNEQLMAELPSDRLASNVPIFSSTGIDYFGPILVSIGRGRAQEKRYGVIFTCLSSRATVIKMARSLNVDSFMSVLRRFINERGPIKIIRSDNGTNLIAGEKEIKSCIEKWNSNQINDLCKLKHIEWHFNPPSSPHFGGVWEREIKTLKKILASLTAEFSNKIRMSDELLETLFSEVENVMNSRPLTAVSSDIEDLEPLTPNHLLKLNSEFVFPVDCRENDIYVRRKWRQAQYLSEVFWTRFRREYLPLLLHRQKWTKLRRSMKTGDLVLVCDQLLPRNMWCTGRIQEVREDKHGQVRSALVKVSRYKDGNGLQFGGTLMERPISKLILLKTEEELSA